MRTILPAALAVLTLYAGARSHAQDADVQDLVSRASRYVEEYERQLSGVVSATYSNFRRFQVTVDERVEVPSSNR